MPPVKPMLAKAGGWDALDALIERGEPMQLEPKWDPFTS
jgi:hypothetical protein